MAAGGDLQKRAAQAYHAFLFAIETAMRAGEIVGLDWARVDLVSRVFHLSETKSGTTRDVPMSLEAVRLIKSLPRVDVVFE